MVSKRRTLRGGAAMLSLALVAVLALSALSAGAASAAEAPRWSANGTYLGTGATKAFTATSTSDVVLAFNIWKLSSPAGECSESGEIEGSAAGTPGTKKNVVLTCKKVQVTDKNGKVLSGCTVRSSGAEIGTIKTNSVKSTLVWLNQTGGAAGDLLAPTSGTSLATIEILGEACAAQQTASLTGQAINQVLPVEKEAVTEQLAHPSTAITSYYNNEAGRVKQTITQLKLGSVAATLGGDFNLSLSTKEPVGVSPASGSAWRWKVGGSFLGTGATKAFTATSTEPMVWEVGDIFKTVLKMPECTETGNLVGSAAGKPGGKEKVALICKGVTVEGNSGCMIRSPGQPTGTIVFNQLHSTVPGGELEAAAGGKEGVLLTPEYFGGACAYGQSSFTGTLRDILSAYEEKESASLGSSQTGSSVKWGSNNYVTVKGGMSTSLTSGEAFGAFLG
jgi:hypothetical protein